MHPEEKIMKQCQHNNEGEKRRGQNKTNTNPAITAKD